MSDLNNILAELDAGNDMDLTGFTLNDLIRAQHYCRQEWDKYKALATRWNVLYDFLSIRVVPDRMEEEGEEGKKLKGVGRIELRADMWTKTLDAPGLQAWLEENGLGDLVVPGVNGSTLKATIKEQMKKKDGKVPGSDLVEVTPYTRAVIVKA